MTQCVATQAVGKSRCRKDPKQSLDWDAPTPFAILLTTHLGYKLNNCLSMQAMVVEYCRRQAMRAPAVTDRHCFESHLLIISLSDCKEQPFHVDAPATILQGILAISNGLPGPLHLEMPVHDPINNTDFSSPSLSTQANSCSCWNCNIIPVR
jgi:hypothetical protein